MSDLDKIRGEIERVTHDVDITRDELEVILQVARGAPVGRKQYGPLDIDKYAKDATLETLEEVSDGLFYLAIEIIKLRRKLRRVS